MTRPPILVIDDETSIRSIVRAAIESEGGTVLEAANAQLPTAAIGGGFLGWVPESRGR